MATLDQVATSSRTTATLDVTIAAVTDEAEGIRAFELVPARGAELPAFTAGAHVDVHLAGGLVRQYSLASDPANRGRYRLAVLKEQGGRGGSIAMHRLAAGGTLMISMPRNNFPLAGYEAAFHLLIAGGIGVTPMIAMIAELERRKADWRLHYCTRSPERTAFRSELAPFIAAGKVVLHHDGGDPARGLDVAALLAEYQPAHHVYVCGPKGLMDAAKASVGAWPPHCVHFEHFTATELTAEEAAWDLKPFQVRIRKTGQMLDVPAGKSIVSVLRAAGHVIETSCEDGYCGTCITRYTAGEPVHRDTVLSEGERRTYVMICRARSVGPLLELDL